MDIENWVSILISLFIIKTGVEVLRECVSKLLGKRADPELQKRIRKAAEQGIRLTAVGICGTNLNEGQNAALWDRILEQIGKHPEFVRAYAFSYDAEEQLAYFYVVPDVTIRKTKDAAVAKLRKELEAEFPGVVFNIDTSVEM